jgi:hypothetical protein
MVDRSLPAEGERRRGSSGGGRPWGMVREL